MKLECFFPSVALNQSITDEVFFHWLKLHLRAMVLLMRSRENERERERGEGGRRRGSYAGIGFCHPK